MPHSARSFRVGRLSFILVGLALILSGCVRRIQPARQFAQLCPVGQVRVCFGRCQPGAPAGGECTVSRDECASGYRPCQQDLVCIPSGTDPAAGTCRPPPSLFCNPLVPSGSPGNNCPAESACVTVGTQAALQGGSVCVQRPVLNLSPQPAGLCRRAQLEGEQCDSEWGSAILPVSVGQRGDCFPCAPGLMCWNTHCRRPCRPEDGGLGNCAPDAQTAEHASQWVCESQPGRRFDPPLHPEHVDTQPLCSVCVNPGQLCQLPPDSSQQALNPGNLCCDSRDFCLRPVNISNQSEEMPAVCSRPPARRGFLGGECTSDNDCGRIIVDIAGQRVEVRHCCDASGGQGCLPGPESASAGHCAGCGPGTGVPCCLPDGTGCPGNERCVGRDDNAVCISCGTTGSSCCNHGEVCRQGLSCFDRPGATQTDDRCEACGAAPQPGSPPQQCCPGNECHDGSTCIAGLCQFCGERGEQCCNGRRCSEQFLACQGDGDGTCVQTCGAPGLQCCGTPGSIFGPPRGYCVGRAECDENQFTCSACGAQSQACCESGTRCDAGLGCDSSSHCVTCGGLDHPCCSVSTTPGQVSLTCQLGLVCGNSGKCVPCGGENQSCCSSVPACIANGTSCSSGICIRPPG